MHGIVRTRPGVSTILIWHTQAAYPIRPARRPLLGWQTFHSFKGPSREADKEVYMCMLGKSSAKRSAGQAP